MGMGPNTGPVGRDVRRYAASASPAASRSPGIRWVLRSSVIDSDEVEAWPYLAAA